MKLVSVRALMILLSLTLVVVSSAICLVLSVTAGEEAINKTENSGNDGIREAFQIAEINVKLLSSDLMSAIQTTAVTFITLFLDTQRRLLGAQRDFYTVLADTPVMIGGRSVPQFHDYNALLAAQIKIRAEVSNSMATGFATTTSRGQFVGLTQRWISVGTNWSEYILIQNNGTDRGQPFANTIAGLVDTRGKYINTKWNCSGGIACLAQAESAENWDPASCSVPVMLNPTTGEGCTIRLIPDYFPLEKSHVPLVMTIFPEGSSAWGPIVNSEMYVGLFLFAPISSKLVQPAPLIGRKVGFTGLGLDLRSISDFLKTIELPQGGLLFVVVPKNDPFIPYPTIGTMVGATRGDPYKNVSQIRQNRNDTHPFPINCTESLDNLTKATCKTIFDRPGAFLGLDMKQTYVMALLDQQHYVKVKTVSDVPTGLMMTLILVVPYETIMGPIDDATAAMQGKIKKHTDDTKKSKERNYMVMYILLAAAAVVLIFIATVFTLAITKPMVVLQDEMANVACMEMEAVDLQSPPSSFEEVRSMQVSFLQMVKSLNAFFKYVPVQIVKTLNSKGTLAILGMYPISATISFTDIKGFTTMCTRVNAAALAIIITAYFEIQTNIVQAYRGVVDKYIGDCLMVLWGAPLPLKSPNLRAICAALAMDRATKLATLRQLFSPCTSSLVIRTGVHTGSCLAGNMGTTTRMNYTVIGDPVNIAARLEAVNKDFGTRILISHGVATAQEAGMKDLVLRQLTNVRVVGREEPLPVYEVMGLRGSAEEEPVRAAPVTVEGAPLSPRSYLRAHLSADAKIVLSSMPDLSDIKTAEILHRARTMCRTVSPVEEQWAAEFSAAVERYVAKRFEEALPLLQAALAKAPAADAELLGLMIRDCQGPRDGVIDGKNK